MAWRVLKRRFVVPNVVGELSLIVDTSNDVDLSCFDTICELNYNLLNRFAFSRGL